MKNKYVLVTGGAGFIGSHLIDELVKNYFVISVDNLDTGELHNFKHLSKCNNFKFVKMDLGDSEATEKLLKILNEFSVESIFHTASICRTMFCYENPDISHQANVNGTLNLLEACRKYKKIKKIVHSSSCILYGDSKEPASKETDELPNITKSPYATQKYMQELYMKLYFHNYDIPSVCLRYFNVYGSKRQSEKGSYPNVLASFSKAKREDGCIYVTGTGEQSRDWVFVSDVVSANICALRSNVKNGDVFNVGTNKVTTINTIAKYFECPIKYIPPRPNDAFKVCADISKTNEILKWVPKVDFDTGIKLFFKS